ncbi:MAG: nucleotidyltransferase family protein [Caulobacteraceae bacterium]
MGVLQRARSLDLPDWMVFSGAIYQRVLNHLTGRPTDYGVKDYDLAYYDGADLSYEAEDVVIKRVAAAFEPPLRDLVEVRNQARVHLWFEGKFGEPYEPLACSAEATERFVSPICSVGVRLMGDRSLKLAAPFGLDDIFALRMRPNPRRGRGPSFDRVAAGIIARWPEVKVVES